MCGAIGHGWMDVAVPGAWIPGVFGGRANGNLWAGAEGLWRRQADSCRSLLSAHSWRELRNEG